MSLDEMVAGPPQPKKKNLHSVREKSRGLVAASGRVKVTVVNPLENDADALTMSWLSSMGGWARASMNLLWYVMVCLCHAVMYPMM